ncbi:MAG: hypothetical protein AB7U76_24100 [Pirellulales bacterium]
MPVEDAHHVAVPLHRDRGADPPGRDGVVGALDLDVPIEVHDAVAVVVVAKRLDWQWLEVRVLLGDEVARNAASETVRVTLGLQSLPDLPDPEHHKHGRTLDVYLTLRVKYELLFIARAW